MPETTERDPVAWERYDQIASELAAQEAQRGAMFGMPCLKANGKAFAGYFRNDMVFKLSGTAHARALALPGAHLFDPSEQDRPMKAWVQVPASSANEWEDLAQAAYRLVQNLA